MVMETPSAQCVGREFVRQYYTLLHEAPLHLHRFYSGDSSFVHGGVEKPGEEQPPVMGQQEIHKKIMSLNFNDCRAKIRQVDSQQTVGDAVVVQVTGELSNNGQPMRRFMQTFVLALQSPKKYYVHNDIFRYQDEVFHDTDSDADHQEEHVDSEPEVVDVAISQPMKPVQDPSITSGYFAEPTQPPLPNGDAHASEQMDVSSPKLEEPVDEKPVEEEPEQEPYDEPEVETEEQQPEQPAEPKTFSWAAMASKNTPAGASAPGPAPTAPKAATAPAKETPLPQRAPRGSRDRISTGRDEQPRTGREDSDFESGRSRPPRFPDSNQLFVGNLPHDVTEKELKTFFETFGKVVELRINTKAGGGRLPNFGFVVFEDTGPVQKVLAEKPIKIRGDHRLNVEEKKARSDGGGRPGSASRQGRGGGSSDRGGRGPPGGDRRGGGRGERGNVGGNRAEASRGPGRGGSANSGGGFGGPRR